MNKNSICLYKNTIVLADAGANNLKMAMSVQSQLMHYGYMLNEEAFEILKKADAADITDYYNDVVNYLKEATGGKHNFKTLYGNFPKDIMSMSLSKLYYNQILHYWTHCHFSPVGEIKEEAFEQVDYKMIKAGSEESFISIFKTIAGAGQSLNPVDTKILTWFGENYADKLPAVDVPFKENLAVIVKLVPTFKVKTVVDVLRVAVSMSGGDPLLPPVPKKLKKAGYKANLVEEERKKFLFELSQADKLRILSLFESSNLDVRDMNQGSRYGRFIRLGEHLPITKMKDQFPRTYDAYYRLRNQKRKGKKDGVDKIRTWASDLNTAFQKDLVTGLRKLEERPGEFFRRIDWLVRTKAVTILRKKGRNSLAENAYEIIQNGETVFEQILASLSRVGEKTSNKVLFEAYTHFESRVDATRNRTAFIKGARQKQTLPDLPALPAVVVEAIQDTIINAIKGKMSQLAPLGKVWIDPELKKIPLPTNMRSMSESLIPVIRGQRLPLGMTKKVIRPFIHWNDQNGSEDLDLHGFLLDSKNPNKNTSFGYNGHYGTTYGRYSGDVRHRRGACAECVDIEIDESLKAGYDTFVMVVHNFTGRPLSTLKDCVVGTEEREFADCNSSWLPATTTNAFKLNSKATYALIGAWDLKNREYIHVDLDSDLTGNVNMGDAKQIYDNVKDMIAEPKLSIFDLLTWHVEARGQNSSKDFAETQFLFEDFSKDYTKTFEYLGV